MLGIVWGIATVTLLIAYGGGFRNVLVGGFDAFGKGAVICWPQQTSEQPGGQRAGKKVVLEQADLDMVKETAQLGPPRLPRNRAPSRIAYGDRMVGTAPVRGVCPEYGEMRNEVPSRGPLAQLARRTRAPPRRFSRRARARATVLRTSRRWRNCARSAACASP